MALATLSIDIEARLAKLDESLNQANRVAEKHASQMAAAFDRVKVAGQAIGTALIGGFSVSAVLNYIEHTAQAATEIERLAQLSGAGVVEFQRYAAGAKSAGVDMDKFSDIMKDVQDKIGDFMSTGGGELKDFFEKVAPKVGVTAEQFRNLSGPQALQLFYSTLERANVGSKEMVFFLESIADDASRLAPLLRDGGAAFGEMGAKAEKAGLIMSERAVRDAAELDKQLKELRGSADAFSQSLALRVIPQLNTIANSFKGEGFWSNFGAALKNGLNITGADVQATAASRAYAKAVDDIARYRQMLADDPGNRQYQQRLDSLEARLPALRTEAERTADALKRVINGPAPSDRSLLNAADANLLGARFEPKNPWKPPPEKKPATDADRYLEQLQKEADKLADLTDLNQALKDVEGGRMEGLTLSLKQRILDQAALNDETRMSQFIEKQLSEQRERDSKLFVGPELPPDIEARITRLNELLKETPTAKLEEARKDMQLLADSFNEGRISAEQFTQAAQARLGTLPDELKRVEGFFDDLKQSIEGWGKDSASAIVDFTITGKSSFSDMVNSMLADMAKMATYRLITQPLFNALGSMLPTTFGSTGGGEVSGPGLKLANGGAFDAGVQAFANGGAFTNSIVDSPTLFKFANGTGLMGEAGPEAIMPLRRDASGRLGVSAAGGGSGSNVHVEIKNYSGAPVQQRSTSDGRGGRRVEVVIGDLAAGEMRRPGSAMHSAAREAYGLSPALVGR